MEKTKTSFIRSFFAALGFLTIVPIPGFLCGTEEDMSRSLSWFVVIGMMIGICVAFIDKGLCSFMPHLPAGALSVLILISVSGGLHMDGLADTADGFFSARPRDRMLEIMRDSRIGAMGVIAIVSIILIKFSILAGLDDKTRFMSIFLAPVAGRFSPVFTIVTMKYVRGENGLGTVFKRNTSPFAFIISILLFFCICFYTAQYYGLIIAAATILFVWGFSFWCVRKIGGWSGDTLGASVEISEAIPPFIFLMIISL